MQMQTVKGSKAKRHEAPLDVSLCGGGRGRFNRQRIPVSRNTCRAAFAKRDYSLGWATNFELEVSSLRLKIRRGDWRSLDLALRLACFSISWNMQYPPTAEPKCLDCTAKVCTNFPEWWGL